MSSAALCYLQVNHFSAADIFVKKEEITVFNGNAADIPSAI